MNSYLKKSILTALSIAALAATFPNAVFAADASRTTELGSVIVPGDIPQLPYQEPDYGFGEYEGWDAPDGGDQGGDFSGVSGGSETITHEPIVCPILKDAAPAGCDLNNPPPLTTNGCGSDGTTAVPDSFFGSVDFNAACNVHDRCYGTAGNVKNDCDLQLETDMENGCTRTYQGTWETVQRNACYTQANTYSVALSTGIGSDTAFANAQKGGQCRKAAKDYKAAGCRQ